jgi:hypothetical protein
MDDLYRMWGASGPQASVVGRHLLRHAVYRCLDDAGRPLRVREIVADLDRRGLVTWRRASQAVSDVLRTEVRAGRVERISRGVYSLARDDPSHRRYVDRALGELRTHPDRRSAAGTPHSVRVLRGPG